LTIEDINESALVQFCNETASNSQIKRHVISLNLSKNTSNGIETFISFVSLEEFSQLQVLTIDYLSEKIISRISPMLPLLTNLRCFCFKDFRIGVHTILELLPKTTIETLSIPILPRNLTLTHPFISLVNLTISRCTVEDLYCFFKYLPSLKYLEIQDIIGYPHTTIDDLRLHHEQLVHLTRLVIHRFTGRFDFLEGIFKRIPNLKVLIISTGSHSDLIDGRRWQYLITTSLPLLKVFKFKFSFLFRIYDSNIVDKFEQFHTEFWFHQHHWYTEYILKRDRALIYTVPYISNGYEVTPDTRRYCNESSNNWHTFVKVTILQLNFDKTTISSQYYFPNVRLLRLNIGDIDKDDTYDSSKTKQIQCLKTMVNLCNLTHLEISSSWHLKPLIQLLKEAPYLSSLKINKYIIMQMFENLELCEYFNKMIKRLDVTAPNTRAFINSKQIFKICQVFSNIEKLRCNIDRPDNLQLILNQLSKLIHMKVFSYKTPHYNAGNFWLQDHQSELDLYSFTIKCESDYFQHDDEYYSSDDPFDNDIVSDW
jgi:hypothetical protein